jgi:hypothetical protein
VSSGEPKPPPVRGKRIKLPPLFFYFELELSNFPDSGQSSLSILFPIDRLRTVARLAPAANLDIMS